MLNRLLVTLLPFLASSCGDRAKPTGEVRTTDPKDILFSLPTLCDPAPAVDSSPAPAGARSLHEDDWRQIEFVPISNNEQVRAQLVALATFKKEHQKGAGWTDVYLRKEHSVPLAAMGLRFTALPAFSTSAVTLSGRPVRGGFALADGEEWFIYGQRSPEGTILQLGISPRPSLCSERFALGLMQITRDAPVLIVDWYAGLVVDVSSLESILAWSRRYQRP
jgi:hypothetical protein